MSFTLKKIEINNIRAHEHFIFEPAYEGVTSISGENGSGKSTIVDSFAWTLYGTRPSGVRNKSLIREGVDPREKPVSVKVTMQIGTVDYIIERKIISKHGSTECNVWGKLQGSEDFNHIAGPGVTHVEKFIRQEIGMNEKGFLTSVLIQQKQVDQIVSASPRERGEVIEELTGIASITDAISKANETTRGLQKAASVMQTGDIDTVREDVKKQLKVYEDTAEKEKQAIDVFQKSKVKFQEASENLDKETEKVQKRRELTSLADNLKEQIDFLEEQAKNDIELIANHKEKYGTTITVNASEVKKELDKLRSEYAEFGAKYKGIIEEVEELKEYIAKCDILAKDVQLKDAKDKIKSLKAEIDELKARIDELKSKRTEINTEIRHSKSSHEHIDGEERNCPVCKGEIEDPEALKEEIQNEIEAYQSELKEVRADLKASEASLVDREEELKEFNVIIEALNEKEDASKKYKKLTNEASKMEESAASMKVELKAIETKYEQALKIEADKDALDAAKERSLTVNTTIDEKKKELDETLKEIEELGALNDRSYNALVKRIDKQRDKLTNMSIAGRELQGRKKLEYERYQDSLERLKREEEVLARYEQLSDEIHKASAASSILQEFKKDRIEHSIPTLEFFASDFLSKFTGGALTKLTLDEKFNAFVTTAGGYVRPIAQLSGGELSAAAIALRLGIAMLINSSEKTVLILDEVLVSMDEDRARQIMETISSMTNAQVIFIAHNSDINSVADKTVLVTKNKG